VLLLVVVGPVPAQPLTAMERVFDGEPTDPEEAIALLGEIGIEGEDVERLQEFEATSEDSWFEEFLDLLRQLGILPEEVSSP